MMIPLEEMLISTLQVIGIIAIPVVLVALALMLTASFLGWVWYILFGDGS